MSDDALIEAMARAMCEADHGHRKPHVDWWISVLSEEGRNDYREHARAALAAIRKTHAVVPREPTMDMKYEGTEAASCNIGLLEARKVYRAMLLAGENHDASK